jgi:hypothetical protein
LSDGANDLGMIEHASLGVAYQHPSISTEISSA